MHNIVSPKGMRSESRDLFKFREINDNISLAVPNKTTVAIEDV